MGRIFLLLAILFTHFALALELEKVIQTDNLQSFKELVKQEKLNPLEVVKVVNKNRYDISNNDYSALSLAIKNNSYKIAKEILRNLSKEQMHSSYLQEMLLQACDRYHKDDTKMVELFLAQDIDVNYTDKYGYTPLMAQAKNGTLKTVKILLDKGAKVDASWKGYPFDKIDALSLALNRGDADIALYLLQNYNFDINKTFKHRHLTSYIPMLGHFVYNENGLKVFELLLNNIDKNIIKKDGKKLLDEIVDKKEVVALANKNSAFREVFDENIYQYLFFAYKDFYRYQDKQYAHIEESIAKCKEQIKLYESYVSDDDAKTRLQKIKATDKKLFLLIEAHNRYDDFLSGKNSELYAKELGGQLLVVSAYHGNIEVMKKLIDSGIDINFLVNLDKEYLRVLYPINPLLAAAKNKQYKSVEFLLKNGANINTKDWYNQNALVYALDGAKKDDEGLVKLLLKSGVDANIQFDEYRLALSEVHFRPLNFALVFTPDLDIVKLVGKYADKDILTGQDYTHITRWLSESYQDGANFSCDRLSYALSITKDKNYIPYHNDTIVSYLTKNYQSYGDIFKHECNRNDALNVYFGTNQTYTQDQIDEIAAEEKSRIKEYVAKRDFATNLLEDGKLDELHKFIEQTDDIATLAKSKSNSFLYQVLRRFESWEDVKESDGQTIVADMPNDKKPSKLSNFLRIPNGAMEKIKKNKKLTEIAKLLIQKGADVNQQSSIFNSQTPFWYVNEYRDIQPEFVKLIEIMKKHDAKLENKKDN